MNLSQHLLPKLSEWQPTGAGRHSFSASIPEANWTVHISADKADSLSCLVWELTLARTGEAPKGLTLRAWAEGIAARVTGLLEPLKLLEVDDAANEALLRSESPSKKDERLAYYEVRLTGLGRAVVRRFNGSRYESGREQAAYALTHEVLVKLVDDIAG